MPRATAGSTSENSHNAGALFRLTSKNLVCRCPSRRLLRRNDRTWGVLSISVETTADQHVPGCPIAGIAATNQTRKLGVRYTGLRRLLNAAVQISFAMQSGAGGWSISPTFTYYPTVDAGSAPAFRMIHVLRGFSAHPGCRGRRGEFMGVVLAKMLGLFQAGKASPLAVDSMNQSLLHHFASTVGYVVVRIERPNVFKDRRAAPC